MQKNFPAFKLNIVFSHIVRMLAHILHGLNIYHMHMQDSVLL